MALAGALARLGPAPLVWVIDDVQWIGADSAALVQRTVGRLDGVPLTLVVTTRPPDPKVSAFLADLAVRVRSRTVHLAGIDRDAVSAWLTASGVDHSPADAGAVQRRTGGNPLFVRELVRTAGELGALVPDAVPEALRDLLHRRLDALGRERDRVLAVTAVAGPLADLPLVAQVAALDDGVLIPAVEDLARDGLLVETDNALTLSHELVRDVVLERLGATRRRWFHLRTADALLGDADRPGVPAELARHYGAAGPAHGDAHRHWSLVAACDALDRVAWDRAAETARSVLDARAAAADDRAHALVVLGRALRGLGDRAGAEQALHEPLALARLHGLPRRFAESAVALAGGGGRGVPDAARFRWVALLEEALAALGDGDDTDDDLRIPLLGSLGVALLLTDRDRDRSDAAARALDLARRHGDPALMARALLDHRFALGAEQAPQRLREVDEAIALAARAHLPEVRTAALVYRHEDLLLLGDRDGARSTLREARAHLVDHPDPYWEWSVATWDVVDHLLDGDLEAAEQAAQAAWSLDPDGAWSQACFGVNLVAIRILQRRAAEVLDLLEAAARANPHIPCYRAVLAYAALEAGDAVRARAELDRFATDGFASVPDDTNRLLTLAMLAEVTVGVAATEHASALTARLTPYADRYVVLTCYGGGGSVWGPVAGHLGGLAAAAGDGDTADRWFGQARDACARMADAVFAARVASVATGS